MKAVLTWNAGSSSLKVGIFQWPSGNAVGEIRIERIGLAQPTVEYELNGFRGHEHFSQPINHALAVLMSFDILETHGFPASSIRASIHRFVYGGKYAQPVELTKTVLKHIAQSKQRAPLHVPTQLLVVKEVVRRSRGQKQIACFDTSFFAWLPQVSQTYALDQRWLQRYDLHRVGYHGLSHASAAREGARQLNQPTNAFTGMTVHIGSGCSVAAIRHGRPVDTSMGATPLEGLVMGTRSGDVDPGLLLALLDRGVSAKKLRDILERRSGLLGMSGYSSDLRDILTAAGIRVPQYRPARIPTSTQRRDSKLALDVFVYRLQKYIGAYAAILGRVDGIVFTGAAGERNATLRKLIMSGVHLPGRPRVLIAKTDEEREMIREARRLV